MGHFEWLTGEKVFNPANWEGLTGTPFQSFVWQRAWASAFGARLKPIGLKIVENKETVAYWVLTVSGSACRTLTPLGVRGSDYLPPLVKPGSEPWPLILEALKGSRNFDLLNLRRLREDQTPLALTAESTCLVLDLPASYEMYEKGLGKSLKTDIRRGNALKISRSDDNIEILFALHAKRWRRRGWPGAFLKAAKNFHRSLEVDRAIYAAWHEGVPIGALYALEGKGATYFYQSGFDPDYARLSPGSVLIAHAIKQSIARGDEVFDFLRGDETYKRRWKPTRSLICGTHLEGLTTLGRMKASLLQTSAKVEASARKQFEGKSLAKSLKPRSR